MKKKPLDTVARAARRMFSTFGTARPPFTMERRSRRITGRWFSEEEVRRMLRTRDERALRMFERAIAVVADDDGQRAFAEHKAMQWLRRYFVRLIRTGSAMPW